MKGPRLVLCAVLSVVLFGASTVRSQQTTLKTNRILQESAGNLSESFGAAIPIPLNGHGGTSVPVGGKVYIYGGANSTNDGNGAPFSDRIFIYDVGSDSWSENPSPMPYPIYPEGASAAPTPSGNIAMSPGNGPYSNNGWGTHNRLIIYDPTAGVAQEDATYPYGAIWAAQLVAAPGGAVYSFGGWTGGGVPDIFRYDEGAHGLIKVGDLAGGGREVLATVVADNGKIYLFGGNEWSGHENAVDIFDPLTETCALSAATIPFPVEQSGVRAWYYGGDIIYIADTYPGPPTFWKYRISTDSFESCSVPFAFSTTQHSRPLAVSDIGSGKAYFLGGFGLEPSLVCFDRGADVNCDGIAGDVFDVIAAIEIAFSGGTVIPCASKQ